MRELDQIKTLIPSNVSSLTLGIARLVMPILCILRMGSSHVASGSSTPELVTWPGRWALARVGAQIVMPSPSASYAAAGAAAAAARTGKVAASVTLRQVFVILPSH
jgi:hypothetical protein